MTFLTSMTRTIPVWCTRGVMDDTSVAKCSVTPKKILGDKFLIIVRSTLTTVFLMSFSIVERIAVEPSVDV